MCVCVCIHINVWSNRLKFSSKDLSRHHDHVVLGRRLAGHLALGVCLQASVKHSIRHLVADLVWVTLVHRLRGEQEGASRACLLLRWLRHGSGSKSGLAHKTVKSLGQKWPR